MPKIARGLGGIPQSAIRMVLFIGEWPDIVSLGIGEPDFDAPPEAVNAAIEALTGPQDCIREHNTIYQRRRDLIIETLNSIGIKAKPSKASLYIWAKVPEGYSSMEFTADLLDQVGVAVTPGVGYGQCGEGYVRLSLTIPDAALVKGLSRLAGWRNARRLTFKK